VSGAITFCLLLTYCSGSVIRVLAMIGLVVSLIWYLLPGHALIYGPHLFFLAILDLFRSQKR
jgi:hypothetical protein